MVVKLYINVNFDDVQNVQHLLGWEDRVQILHLLGFRLEHSQEFVPDQRIVKVYPFWAGDLRWAGSRREDYLRDTRRMISLARAEALSIRINGATFRGSRLAINKYRRPGELRSVSHLRIGINWI